MNIQKIRGFTLLELLVVMAIIAILAALAYPSYTKYGQRSRRADGRELLMRIASAEERYYTTNNLYATSIGDVSALGMSLTSENGYYTMDPPTGVAGVAVGPTSDQQSYTLTATPVPGGMQATDACGNLIIDSSGKKSYSGVSANDSPTDPNANGNCW